MAKLRHIAIAVPDPEKAAKFYSEVFGLEIVEPTESPIASGVYLSDGTICLALLNYKTDAAAGLDRGKNWVGTHHFGFWVDDLDDAAQARIEAAWRQVLHGLAARQGQPLLRSEIPRSRRRDLRHLPGRMGRRQEVIADAVPASVPLDAEGATSQLPSA